MGTKEGTPVYSEILLSELDYDLEEADLTPAILRAALLVDASTILFGAIADGHGLRAGATMSYLRDRDAMWDGLPGGTASLECVVVGYDEEADNAEYALLNAAEGVRMNVFQIDSVTGLCKKIVKAPIVVDEVGEGNVEEIFTVKATRTGAKANIWQRKKLPLVIVP